MTTYISVDVETLSLIPESASNLVSIGAVDVDNLDNTFHAVLRKIPEGAGIGQDSVSWWNAPEQAEALKRINSLYVESEKDVRKALKKFVEWVPKKAIFVAWPASFDYPYVQIALAQYGLENPFNYRTVDVKSWACGKYGVDITADRDQLPDWLYEEAEFPHDALSDAIAQAKAFKKLRDGHEAS